MSSAPSSWRGSGCRPARPSSLLAAPEVAGEAHALSKLRRSVPYTLSEPEERLLNERDATALKAWQTLFNRHVSTLATDFDAGGGSEPHTVSQLTSFLGYPDRDLRRRANEALRELVVPEQPLLAQCYDTIVADRLLLDRLQGYPEPMLRTNLENELETGEVLAMLDAVEAAYPLAQRWLRVKARCLELPVLSFSDIRAPLGDTEPILWPEAVELAAGAFERVSPELAAVAKQVLRRAPRRCRAAPREVRRSLLRRRQRPDGRVPVREPRRPAHRCLDARTRARPRHPLHALAGPVPELVGVRARPGGGAVDVRGAPARRPHDGGEASPTTSASR